MNRELKEKLILISGSAGITAAVFLGIKYLFPLAAPFVLAFLAAVLLEKQIVKLSNVFRGNMTVAATIIVAGITVVIAVIIGAIGYFAFGEIKSLIGNFDYYCALCDFRVSQVCERVDGWLGLEIGCVYEVLDDGIDMVRAGIEDGGLAGAVGTSFSVVSKIFKNIIIVTGSFFIMLISIVFMSRDMDKFRSWKQTTRFSKEASVIWHALSKLGNVYFKTQLIIICCTASVCTVGFLLLKNPYAVVLGIAIGLLDALPFFGTGTVLIPWSIISLLDGNVTIAAVLITIYVITYFLREILESKLMGEKLDIAPVTMMAAIYIGLLVYGFLGFVLGPVSYCLIKAGIQLLKSTIERGRITNI